MKNIQIKPYIKYIFPGIIILVLILQIEGGKKLKSTAADKRSDASVADFNQLPDRRVKVDSFNRSVTDKMRNNIKPVRGGSIRVRVTGNPTILNPLLYGDSSTGMILSYLYDSLVNRDPETLEYRPWMARYWEKRDTVFLKNGKVLSGKIEKTTPTSVTLSPYSTYTFALTDIKELDEAKNKIVLFNGKVLHGKIKKYEYTLEIETQIKGRTQIVIPSYEIKNASEENNAASSIPSGVVPNSMFIFYLRKNIEWHDSKPDKRHYFTADDVIFSYKTMMNPYVDAQRLRGYYKDVYSVKKIGPRCVSFTYNKAYFASFEVCSSTPIVPSHLYNVSDFAGDKASFGRAFNRHRLNVLPIGNGPYKLKKWETSKMVSLERNENYWASKAGLAYWDRNQPYLDKIDFIIISNKLSALKALLNGEVDADFDIEPSIWFDPLTNAPSFRKRFVRASDVGLIYTYIGWNAKSAFFKDRRVRRAMTHLIPRKKILKQIHFGLGKILTGPIYPKSPAYNHSIRPYKYNPELAKKLLTKAGWVDTDGDGIRDKNGVKFEFEYLIHNMKDYHQRIADIIKEHVERAGIKMTIRKLDWSIFMQRVNEQKFDAVRLAWGMSVDPDPYQLFHSSQSKGKGNNYVNYKNREADRILERARQEFDDQKRWAMYREFHMIMHKTQPYTFMFNMKSLLFYNKYFRNVKLYYSSVPYNFNEWYFAGKRAKSIYNPSKYNIIAAIIMLALLGGILVLRRKVKKILENKSY